MRRKRSPNALSVCSEFLFLILSCELVACLVRQRVTACLGMVCCLQQPTLVRLSSSALFALICFYMQTLVNVLWAHLWGQKGVDAGETPQGTVDFLDIGLVLYIQCNLLHLLWTIKNGLSRLR